ncbi:MAG: putative esterase [Bacteroidia bacterium]|jgi:predicted esterase
MEAHHFETPKTARYFTLGDLQSSNEHWYVLHGYGHDAARFIAKFEPHVSKNRAFIAPEGMHRFYTNGNSGNVGASWMTKEDRASDIHDYLRFLDGLANALSSGKTIHVLGFSQGAATASRWVVHAKQAFKALVLWAGMLPPDLNIPHESLLLKKVEITVVYDPNDPYRTDDMWDKTSQFLLDNNLKYKLIEYTGGHKIMPEPLKDLLG